MLHRQFAAACACHGFYQYGLAWPGLVWPGMVWSGLVGGVDAGGWQREKDKDKQTGGRNSQAQTRPERLDVGAPLPKQLRGFLLRCLGVAASTRMLVRDLSLCQVAEEDAGERGFVRLREGASRARG